jgi:DNA repair exonuclease SbcCD nuclease subunit
VVFIKLLYLTDTHITGRNPASRVDDIQETLKKKFTEVGDIANREQVDFIVHGGDLNHTPDVSNKLSGEITEIIKAWNKKVYVVPGNHDLYGYNINTLPNTKLGLLAKAGTITILDRLHPVKIVTPSGFVIGLEGQEYYENIDNGNPSDYQSMFPVSDVDFSILIVHGMLLDHEFFNGVKHTKIDDINTDADVVFAGHYHPGFTQVTVDGTTYCNPGSLLRIENTKENRTNIPQVAILEVDEKTGKFDIKYIKLTSAQDGEDVFTDKQDVKAYDETLSEFQTKIKGSNFRGVDIIKMVDDYIINNGEDSILGQLVKDKINSFSVQKAVDNGYITSPDNVYINRVEIKNFQANKKRIVDFVDGLNVIKGESNAGKSAILRAIYWVLYDKPSGSDFITTGAKSCSVRLHLSNGIIIERKRSRSSSGSYLVTSANGVQEFKGFSNNIPIEITNAHQMPELKINGVSYRINIASQLDPAFLIGNSQAERLSMIGSLVDADRADEAKKDFQGQKIRKSTEKKNISDILKSKQNELAKYDYLAKMEKDIKVLEVALKRLEDEEDKVNTLNDIYNEHNDLYNEMTDIDNKLNSIVIIDKNTLNEYEDIIDDLQFYYSLYDDDVNYNKELDDINSKLDSIPDSDELNKLLIEYKDIVNELDELNSLESEYKDLSEMTFDFDYNLDELNSCISEYRSLIQEIETLVKLESEYKQLESPDDITCRIKEIDDELNSIQESKQTMLEELNKQEAVCPYCHQKIDYNLALQ